VATQRSSRLVGIARAGLTAAVAVGLARVFAASAWPFAAAFAAVSPHAVVAFADRRRWNALAVLGSLLAVGIVFSAYTIEPHTLRGVLPTGETVRQYLSDLGNATHELRTAVVPVDPRGSALLLALLALFVAGAIAEWSARRLEVSLGAVAPSLVLFVACAALGEGSWVATTGAYAIAIAAYLLALNGAELTDRRSWFHAAAARRSQLVAGGSAAAAAVVTIAALIGPQLPGARSDAWFDYRSLGDGDGGSGLLSATTPIVNIQAKLRDDPDKVVMTVQSDAPSYWRVIGLDTYDGNVWTLNDEGSNASDIPDPEESPTSIIVQQRYEIAAGDPHWLPAAYRPIAVSLENARVVRESLTLYLENDAPLSGVRYSVQSIVATPTDAEFAASDPVDPADFERYVALPDDFPARIRDLAREVTAAARTPYEKATALRDYLGRNPEFTYDLDVARAQDIDTLEDFLFEVRRGYCEQFATAYGAMARSVGLPTRIAVGYNRGEDLGDGRYQVRNRNAHAWPEVYLASIGWVPFDPTPGIREPTIEGGAGVIGAPDPPPESTSSTSGTTAVPGSTTPTSARAPFNDPEVQVGAPSAGDDDRSAGERILATVVALAASVVLISAAVVAVLVALAYRRRWHRRHGRDARDRVLGAWAQALDHLAEAGIDPKPSATATEFALRYAPAQGAGEAGAPLVHLAKLQTIAMFAPRAPSDAQADEAWRHSDEIDKALWARVPKLRRWARRLDPRRYRDDTD